MSARWILGFLVSGCATCHLYRPQASIENFDQSEQYLLSHYLRRTTFELRDVPLHSDQHIHTLVVHPQSQEDSSKPSLVLVHGWGAGLAQWAKNIDDLSQHYNIYAIDLLGFGRSSRPYFPRSPHATPQQARDFWVESLHEWKTEVFGSEPVIFVGHSLGGYLACSYALEHPEHLKYFFMIAPVGIAPWKFSGEGSSLWKITRTLVWDYGLTPQALLRATGYASQRIWMEIGKQTEYRDLTKEVWAYFYYAKMQEPSGERAFVNLLTQNGWGDPLMNKLDDLKVPGYIIYGDRDWVPGPRYGPEIVRRAPLIQYEVFSDAGHHFYWSHADTFNRVLIRQGSDALRQHKE